MHHCAGCGTAAAAITNNNDEAGWSEVNPQASPFVVSSPGLSVAVRAGRDSWDHVQLDARGDLAADLHLADQRGNLGCSRPCRK